jgi:hypothetical protein
LQRCSCSPGSGPGQSEQEKPRPGGSKSKAIAQAIENNSLILNVYDCHGAGTIGERGSLANGLVAGPHPGGMIKPDLKETSNLLSWTSPPAPARITNSPSA